MAFKIILKPGWLIHSSVAAAFIEGKPGDKNMDDTILKMEGIKENRLVQKAKTFVATFKTLNYKADIIIQSIIKEPSILNKILENLISFLRKK